MSRQATKQYSFKGLAGCVSQSVSRRTKTLVGIYHGVQAGMAEEGWVTVCEPHGGIVEHAALKDAKSHAVDPSGWCPTCQGTEPLED